MKQKVRDLVLQALMDSSDYISGESLSERFNVSRTSIWKNIKKLKEEGYTIESVNNKGYRLVEATSRISPTRLRNELNALGFGMIQVDDSVDSTNMEAKRQADSFEGNGLFVGLEQLQGRGRRGKTWISKKGDGIYMTLLVRPQVMPQHASMLTLIAGVAVTDALKELYDVDGQIKWPNDIVIHGKKVSGTLTEMSSEIDALHYVVIGIGINVNQEDFDDEISHMATSLSREIKLGTAIDQTELVLAITKNFMKELSVFEKEKNLAFIKDRYEAVCINMNRDVVLHRQDGNEVCRCTGINEDGSLTVVTEDGGMKTVNAGEVSIRGVYGKYI